MADITKCKDGKCPNSHKCYRFTAFSNDHWQSYFVESPRQIDNSCGQYWPIKPEDEE